MATELGQAVLVETSVETALHSDDVELISEAICEQLELGGRAREDVLAAARLHDIGKSALPREVLEKPGPLNDAEWKEMRRHTIVGERILASVQELKGIARLVRHSHERWDGKGYPDGLAGEEIPLGSRIIFCADAFHAVRSDRPYRRGSSAPAALEEVKRCGGTQFDPAVVAALEGATRELKLLPRPRRPRRSSRLTALLLVLALGAGGTAVGRSDLLGPVPSGSAGSGGLAICTGADCSLVGPLLSAQLEGIGLPVPGSELNGRGAGDPPRGGIGAAGVLQRRGDGTRARSKRRPKRSGVTAPVVTSPDEPVQDAPPSGSGSGAGGSSRPAKPKPRRGNGGGNGGGVGNQGQGGSAAPGTGNGNANPGSWAGGGAPGNSGNAPGHNN
ncbi:MAG: HD-GYP domain-containing protein [Solirubrobacterales bacterium]